MTIPSAGSERRTLVDEFVIRDVVAVEIKRLDADGRVLNERVFEPDTRGWREVVPAPQP